MKISKPTISKTIEFLICISFLSLTFRHEISSVCLYLTGFLSIIELIRRKKNYFDKNNFVLLFFISYFLVEIIGMFYSKNLYFGIKDIESKFLFVIATLMIIAANKFSNTQILFFLKYYLLGVLFNLIYLITIGYIEYNKTSNFPKYVFFSVFMHPTYFSFCLVTASTIILEFYNKLFKFKIILFVLLLLITFGILKADSKAGLLSYFLIIIFFSIRYFLTFKLKIKIIIFVLSIITSLFFVNQTSNLRFSELFRELQTSTKFNDYNGNYNSTETRIIIWRTTKKVIKNNLLIGTGTGDIKDELMKEFEKINYTDGINKKYNCHNQFLQIIATFGIILGVPLVLIFLKIYYDTLRSKKLIFNLITTVFIINLLFESFLETKAGVETFVLFTVCLSSAIYYNRSIS